MFATTFLRGFQNKNVASGYYGLAFGCGAIMALLDGAVVVSLSSTGLSALPATALGAAFGWVFGMKAHNRITKSRRKAEKAKKREKMARQIDDAFESRYQQVLRDLHIIK
jgi:uncharacterized membrane protein